MALIELDLRTQPEPAPTADLPPARRYRVAGLLIAAVLAVALGGAAPPGVFGWRHLGDVPVSVRDVSESPFRLDGDRLYTVGGQGRDRTVTAWQMASPPTELWSVVFPPRVVRSDQVQFGNVQVVRAGPVVLLSDGPAVTAVDASDGRVRWRSDLPVQPLADGSAGLVEEPRFRAGTTYDQESGNPGPLYFSADGSPHTEPPVDTVVRAIDLATGRTTWSQTQPGAVNVFATGSGVLILAADRLTLRSPSTGAQVRTTGLPPISGEQPYTAAVLGDDLLVTYGDTDARARTLAAYDARTLGERWRVAELRPLFPVGDCEGLACANDGLGTSVVVDSATGKALWRLPDGVDLLARAPGVVELTSTPSRPKSLVEPRTGRTLVDLAGWTETVSGTGDTLLLRRSSPIKGAEFAVVTGDPAGVRPLGSTPSAVSDCAANGRFVVCRAAGRLEVFAYRSGS